MLTIRELIYSLDASTPDDWRSAAELMNELSESESLIKDGCGARTLTYFLLNSVPDNITDDMDPKDIAGSLIYTALIMGYSARSAVLKRTGR